MLVMMLRQTITKTMHTQPSYLLTRFFLSGRKLENPEETHMMMDRMDSGTQDTFFKIRRSHF